jgi:hypothetical protein
MRNITVRMAAAVAAGKANELAWLAAWSLLVDAETESERAALERTIAERVAAGAVIRATLARIVREDVRAFAGAR